MEVKPCNINSLKVVRGLLLLLLAILFMTASGCSTKSTVSYISHGENENPPPIQALQDLGALAEMQDKADAQAVLAEAKNRQALYELRKETLKKHYDDWKGTRYRYGGMSRKGIDCSGFTLLTYKELFGKNLPRTVREQVKKGQKVKKTSLQPGDLVFFKTGRRQKHVGIYLDDERFMHASLSHGVMISQLNNAYWKRHFWQAKRF